MRANYIMIFLDDACLLSHSIASHPKLLHHIMLRMVLLLMQMVECSDSDTVPVNFQTIARGMALEGCYVLGVGTKMLDGLNEADVAVIDRDSVEGDISLMGLISYRNELKVGCAACSQCL
jgi:hypothetical protein